MKKIIEKKNFIHMIGTEVFVSLECMDDFIEAQMYKDIQCFVSQADIHKGFIVSLWDDPSFNVFEIKRDNFKTYENYLECFENMVDKCQNGSIPASLPGVKKDIIKKLVRLNSVIFK